VLNMGESRGGRRKGEGGGVWRSRAGAGGAYVAGPAMVALWLQI
jgi:hypothetical protein